MNRPALYGARPRTSIKRQRGVSMLEVMVSIVVIALGLLGLAGLQMVSLKSSNTAYLRSQATILAYDIVDRMRANQPAAMSGNYNIAIGTSASGSGVAGADLAEWKQNIAQNIPAGDGSVTVDIAGNATIIIQWDGDGNGTVVEGNGKDTKFITQTQL